MGSAETRLYCWSFLLLMEYFIAVAEHYPQWFITFVLFCVFLFLRYSCTSSSGWQCKCNPGIWTSC